MLIRRGAALLSVMVAATLLGSAVMAAESSTTSTVTASVGSPAGTRILQPVNAPGAIVFGTSKTASTTISASVVESLADGVASWSVSIKAGNFVTSDGLNSIDASNLTYTSTSNLVTAAGDLSGTMQDGTNGSLDGAGQTMFTVTGETAGLFPGYTGTYTGTGELSLTLPQGTPSGSYNATVTVTMVA